jgi:hypothetical protein
VSSLEREYTTETHAPTRGRATEFDGRHRGGGLGRSPKPFFLTSEFFVLAGMIAAVMIAAGVAANFHSARAWTLAVILGAAYILSRGLSKIGRGDGSFL